MSEKFEAFKAELIALCEKYNVTLSTDAEIVCAVEPFSQVRMERLIDHTDDEQA